MKIEKQFVGFHGGIMEETVMGLCSIIVQVCSKKYHETYEAIKKPTNQEEPSLTGVIDLNDVMLV